MGCCQNSSLGNEIVLDRRTPTDNSIKPDPLGHLSSESDQKFTPTPSFGSANQRFIFEPRNIVSLEIN
ncbi:hypothetical protein SteCoe_4119 [Stentor coeruleus]|uniref:Uncharacterized protein n=1 Tax=Stentor coeruleus TaxID=5963 RepID=A0A1R2CVJ8_9CILI|nr:hypothetical protein SteCoe_4119 [Stentor coeruleus]